MNLADCPADGVAVRWQQTDDLTPAGAVPYDVVGIVWGGDLCFGDPNGWCELPWATFVADVAEYGYINVQVATGWDPVT